MRPQLGFADGVRLRANRGSGSPDQCSGRLISKLDIGRSLLHSKIALSQLACALNRNEVSSKNLLPRGSI